jgi:hypothetical protein
MNPDIPYEKHLIEVTMTDSLENLLEKLMENEMELGRLYHLFAEIFPVDSEFWMQISREEQVHADWLLKLQGMAQKEDLRKGSSTLTLQAIDTALTYMRSVSEKCKNGELSRKSAFAIALDIENSLLEKQFFTVVDLSSPPYQEVQKALIRETQEHRKKIVSALNAFKTI